MSLPDRTPLDELSRRLDKAKEDLRTPQGRTDAVLPKGWRLGMRLATEILSAIVIGFAIGAFLDQVFGTKPVFMLVFFLFGVAAGFLTVYRSVRALEREERKNDGHAD